MKERTRDKKAYATLGCRSFDLPLTHCFRLIPHLLPSSSSMEFLEFEREYAMHSTPQIGQVHVLLKPKYQYKLENRMGKRTAAQKTKELGSARGARRCVHTARPCIPYPGPWCIP